MENAPYQYANRGGIRPISWEDFHGICKALALAAYEFGPDIVLATGRGGYYPGTLLAHMLEAELFPIRLSRRVKGVVHYKSPQWLIEPPALVVDRRVLIVDEICDSGETLTLVRQKVEALGAGEIRSAVLYAHSWSTAVPDYIGLITDELLLNPWDREIVQDGRFVFHPEYVDALASQGFQPDDVLRTAATPVALAKG